MKTLHKRNLHNDRYDFKELTKSNTSLEQYVSLNKYDDLSIDFFNADAVLALNKALLSYFYNLEFWEIPKNYLCPPIPGRADHIHYIADLLKESNRGTIPKGKAVKVLDIGVGANCIYPIVGNSIYGWSFTGSDIDEDAVNSAKDIVKNNKSLNSNVNILLQTSSDDIFKNIIQENDKYSLTICNPPFHKSKKEAIAGSKRKVNNLTKSKKRKANLNFGGQNNELWCKGGEVVFITTMIKQSEIYKNNSIWFTTLVSKKESLDTIYKELKKVNPTQIKTINMSQGNKQSRIVAWSFQKDSK
ncbi:MAG TPA: 23S rRNA (adenine(1618)-N(6))-methyltransferase RlmF [Arcobacter sp.]|nr:23S rRNA (adenine(1618)-N(6))-methyltransferase RlmF [Arcobacter sp.]HIP55663.1 23S rRNA (adenine(1618)-N(6))-methyltransferase RlmF [Arcobacter sp.]